MDERARKALTILFQVVLAFLGLSTIASGTVNFVYGVDVLGRFFDMSDIAVDPALRPIIDLQIRVMSGVWIAVGLGLLLAVRNFQRHTLLIRIALLGLALSAVGDFVSIQDTGAFSERSTTIALQLAFYVFMEVFRHFAAKAASNPS